MADFQQLEAIYGEYEQRYAQAQKQAGLFAGAFHMGDDPRKDVCNQVFYEALGQWIRDFLDDGPGTEEAEKAAGWILNYPGLHRDSGTYWMAYAAQGHVRELIPLLQFSEMISGCFPIFSAFPDLLFSPALPVRRTRPPPMDNVLLFSFSDMFQ